MGRKAHGRGKKAGRTKLDIIPQIKVIEGSTFYLQGSFINKNKAQALSKRLHKQGNYSRVIEVQRGRRKYLAVYVRSGRKEAEKKAKRERRRETYGRIGDSVKKFKF